MRLYKMQEMTNIETLKQNVEKVRQNIAQACGEADVRPEDIVIIAATKTVDTGRMSMLKDLEIHICGENRAQELMEKYGKVDTEWHFIGRLQTNKVKYIIDKVTLIHSLDRVELAREIQRQCVRFGIAMDCLIEVNIGEEGSKGGVSKEEVEDFYEQVSQNFPSIKICGLMAMLPIGAPEKLYLQMRDIYDKMKARHEGIKYLSMGMSDDYATAIKHGANMVRLGRVLFGERVYR